MKRKITASAAALAFFLIPYLFGGSWGMCAAASAGAGAVAYALPLYLEKRKERNRNRSYDMDIPDLLIHVSMLTEAGLTIWDAVERAAMIGDPNRPLYQDILTVFDHVRRGYAKDPAAALENLSAQRSSAALSNFCTIVIQNVRKGSVELSTIFATQAQLYRTERRRTAGKIAEEAVTLLLIPSTIVLVALIILLLAPAVMNFIGDIKM